MSGDRPHLLAVLRTDIVESTNYQLHVGDEIAVDEMGQHLRLLESVTTAHGGTVLKRQGDGVFAAFDSTSAAIRAAQEIQATTSRRNRWQKKSRFEIRIGISVGELVEVDGELTGRPMIEADRLQSVAEPGQILASALATSLTGGRVERDLEPVGHRALKGFDLAVEVVSVLWDTTLNPLAVLDPLLERQPPTSFVGRSVEYEHLEQLWDQAAAGQPRIVLIEGEPGVGKSRLARELAMAVHLDDAITLYGSSERDDEKPYGPLARSLDQFASSLRGESYYLGPHAADLVPLVGDLPDRLPDLVMPMREDVDSSERASVHKAIEGWLSTASHDEPMLIVLDDLQWAPPQTVSALAHLANRLMDERLLIVGTLRPQTPEQLEASLSLTELRRADFVTSITLGGLDRFGTLALMEGLAGHALEAPDETAFADQIWRHTDGNPFFVQAVLANFAAQGDLRQIDGRWTAKRAPSELGPPPAVRDAVLGQLIGLGAEGLQLLQAAAVLGSEFHLTTLHRLSQELGFRDLGAIETARRAGLLYEVRGETDLYRFSHEIVRSVFESELDRPGLARLHELAATALSDMGFRGTDVDHDLMSYHLSFSLDHERQHDAASYAVDGGKSASKKGAYDEANALFRRAIDLLENRSGARAVRLLAEALLGAALAARRAGDPSASSLLLRTIEVAEDLGDGALLARVARIRSRGMFAMLGAVDDDLVALFERALMLMDDEPTKLRAEALASLGAELNYSHDRARQRALLDEAEAMAMDLKDNATLVKVSVLKGNSLWRPATLSERLRLSTDLEALTQGLAIPGWQFAAASFGFQARMEEGLFSRADELLHRMEQLAGRIQEPIVDCYLNVRSCARRIVQGRFDEAKEHSDEARSLGEEAGLEESLLYYVGQQWSIAYHLGTLGSLVELFAGALSAPSARPVIRPALAAIHAECGELQECREVLRQVDHRYFLLDDQDQLVTAAVTAIAAHAVADSRRGELAYDVLRPFEEQMIDNGSTHFGSVQHYLGLAALATGRADEAAVLLSSAVRVHRSIGNGPMAARSQIESARLTLDRGRSEEVEQARTTLRQLSRDCQESGLARAAQLATDVLASHPVGS